MRPNYTPIGVGSRIYIPVRHLHPTQPALGRLEVEHKVKLLRKMKPSAFADYLELKITPVVIGPRGQLYLIDHHHHAASLIRTQRPQIYIEIIANWSQLTPARFWAHMKKAQWVYLRAPSGKTIMPTQLPKDLEKMQSDPYRSLAWQVREHKGFTKADEVPYFEFAWARFFQSYIPEPLLRNQPKLALTLAMKLARTKLAKSLPGYRD